MGISSICKSFTDKLKNLTFLCITALSCQKNMEVIVRINSPDQSLRELEELTDAELEELISTLLLRLNSSRMLGE